PRLFIVFNGQRETLPTYDTYFSAALGEALENFQRCRRSICRSHMLCLAGEYMRKLDPPQQGEATNFYKKATGELFWEHAETSYIRLASFWDRIGQLLDFVFFNIRQYERDGFPAVMDRLRVNFVLVNDQIDNCEAWKLLRAYQTSEKPEGLNWLLRRRNL